MVNWKKIVCNLITCYTVIYFVFQLWTPLISIVYCVQIQGADPGFQVRGGALKKNASSGGRHENFWGISCEKSRFYAKKIIFFPILGGAPPPPPPWIRPWDLYVSLCQSVTLFLLIYMQFFILSLHWKYTICILVNIIRETNPISLCYK